MVHDKQFCCFTGHRAVPMGERVRIISLLRKTILDHISLGCRTFVAGGALGFDTYAAQTVISLREEDHHPIRLVIVAPFEGQAERWKTSEQFLYENIRNSADDYICLSAGYQKDCMRKRNFYMVDLSSYCIAYCTDSHSGTSQTVTYAKKKGVEVTNLAADFPLITFK